MVFRDRDDAGWRLAEVLSRHPWRDPIVLALPRGGVPVAAPVAAALQAPLDVIVARKVGAPGQPELGMGALCEGDDEAVWRPFAQRLVPSPEERATRVAAARREIGRRVETYRGGRALPALAARDVILVDDGLATGVTAEAALVALARHQPAAIVLAVPVGAPDTVERLAPLATDIVCLTQPDELRAVGAWYRSFAQTTDDEVRTLLARPSPTEPSG